MFRILALALTGAVVFAAPLDIPFVRQSRAGCGSAAVAMVMQYWIRQDPALNHLAAEVESIDHELPAKERGVHGQEMKQYLERHGFSVFVIDGEVSDLMAHSRKGRPVIVCLAPGGPKAPFHFAVVAGVTGRAVILNDSARGKLFEEKLDSFLRSWSATGNWAMLAVPRPRP